MTTVHLTRRVRFSAAHRYYRPEWSEARNREVFGACANPHGHGHNYVLEVTVTGEVDPRTGFAIDLAELDAVLQEVVVRRLDHQHLNHAVERFAEGRQVPTTENLVALLWELLEERLGRETLVRLRLREDEDLWVDCYGEGERMGGSDIRHV